MVESLQKEAYTDDSSTINVSLWIKHCTPLCGNPYILSTTSICDRYDVSYYRGVNTPNFHARKRQGELLPQTPFEQFHSRGSTTGSFNGRWLKAGDNYDHIWSEDNYSIYDYWIVTPEVIKSYVPEISDVYVQSAAAKIYSEGHDTLTFIAELTDLRRMFLSTGKKLLKLDFPRDWKSLSNDWLMARYGWRPFLSDLVGLDKAISNLNTGKQRISKIATGNRSWSETQAWTTETVEAYGDHLISDSINASFRGSVVADVDIPEFQFNPLQAGWEIIPFSFVIDWFVNVGKSISAASFLALQSSYSASNGLKLTVDRSYSYSVRPKPTHLTGSFSQSANCFATYVTRSPCSVSVKPQYSLRLNPFKILDLLGLITQRIRR